MWTSTGGTLLPKGGSAFYTAPLLPGTTTVTATSVANPEVSATTSIQVSAPPTSTPTLSALPTTATLRPNQRLFIGTAYRSTDPSAGLDWTASGGMLTVDGSTASAFYTALAEGAYTVSIASRANPALTAQVAVSVLASEAPAWAVTPSALTVGTGQAAFFEAVDASGVIRSRVLWTVQEGPAAGSISDAGQYFAPTSAGTYHVIATNPLNSAESATAAITVVSGGGGGGPSGRFTPSSPGPDFERSPGPSSVTRRSGAYQSLSAVVSGMEDQTVTWTVENDPGSASVDASGVFTANQAGTYRVITRPLLGLALRAIASRRWPFASCSGLATSTPNQALKGSAVLTVVSSVTALPNAPVVGTLRGYSVTALADGRILIAGGRDGSTYFATARLFDPETKVFSNTPAMLAPRAYHTATLLADGRVLLAGGVGDRDEFGEQVANAWAEVFNPVTNAFEALPEGPLPNGGTRSGYMRSPHATMGFPDDLEHYGHGQGVTTVLGNGQVLIAGGPMVHGYGFGGSFDQFPQRRMTDLFTPGTTPGMDTFDVSNWVGNEAPDDVQGWALTPNAIITPKGAQILTLNDGRALMTGGLVSPYQNLPVIPEPYRSGLIMLDSKTYSPGQGFADAAPMRVPRAYHTMTKLADGRVLIVGGYASLTLSDDFNTSLIWHRTTTGTAEVYDPATGGFTFVGSLIFPRARHAAILLPTGKVMIVGGRTTNGDGGYFHPKIIELFDPETGAFEVMEELEYGIEEPKLALQADGNVFVMGTVKGYVESQTNSGQNSFATPNGQPVNGNTTTAQIDLGKMVFIDRINMNQGVERYTNDENTWLGFPDNRPPFQAWRKDVPRISNRPTRIRVHVDSPQGTMRKQVGKLPVRISLVNAADGVAAMRDVTLQREPEDTTILGSKYVAMAEGQFLASEIQPGLRIKIELDPNRTMVPSGVPEAKTTQVEDPKWEPSPKLTIQLVNMTYRWYDSAGQQQDARLSTAEVIAYRDELQANIRRMFPVSMDAVDVLTPDDVNLMWDERGTWTMSNGSTWNMGPMFVKDSNGQWVDNGNGATSQWWYLTRYTAIEGQKALPMTPTKPRTYLAVVMKEVPNHNILSSTYTGGMTHLVSDSYEDLSQGFTHAFVVLNGMPVNALHELGHANQRRHTPNMSSSAPWVGDPNYVSSGGTCFIGVDGWDPLSLADPTIPWSGTFLRNGTASDPRFGFGAYPLLGPNQLPNPLFKDLMDYASMIPGSGEVRWISDFTFANLFLYNKVVNP